MTAEVVPFGKYKGRPVDEMLADAGYMEWIGAQPWFREKFGRLIAAHDAVEAEATPVHNRLQALFLDEGFRASFCEMADGRAVQVMVEREAASRTEIMKKIEAMIASAVSDVYAASKIDDGKKVLEILRSLPPVSAATKAAFEAPQDVVITATVQRVSVWSDGYTLSLYGIGGGIAKHDPHEAIFRVEIKPIIGDDYPVVLRQMGRNNSKFLFVDQFRADGVTESQFLAMFKASGKTVVFKRDVNAAQTDMRHVG